MIVTYCFNHAWAKHIPVQLFALHQTNPQIEKVYLISDWIPDGVWRQIDHYNISWIIPGKFFNDQNVRNRFGLATLWRLLIPWYVHESRCLYVDADTLVVADVSELLDIYPETIAGVVDTGSSPRYRKRIGHTGPYINAGVLWMNLNGIRATGLGDKWIEMANARNYGSQDQDIINLTINPLVIGNEFNSSVSTGIHEQPKIVHYAGKKGENWVKGMRQDEHWNEWQRRYDTEGDRLRMVRRQSQASAGRTLHRVMDETLSRLADRRTE